MKLRYKIVTFFVILVSVFLYGRCSNPKITHPGYSGAPVLPVADTEQIKFNPDNHTLQILTSSGLKTVTLPDRTSTIDIQKNGIVKVTAPQFGFEHHMFVGITGSDKVRLSVGMDGLYYKKLDLGIGIAATPGLTTPIIQGKITYNVYGAIQTGIVYQSNKYIGGIVSVRVF